MGYGIVASAGIDYITATGESTSAQVLLANSGWQEIARAKSRGNDERAWTGRGYRGVACGDVSLGVSDNGTILRVSGSRATDILGEIVHVADRISRLDLQSTVRFSRDVRGLARHHGAEIQRYKRQGGRKRNTSVIATYGDGDTLTLGSRLSNYYGRVYDKHRESGDDAYKRCWRYEVEVKHDAAPDLAHKLATSPSVTAEVEALVHDWFTRRGLDVRYRPGLAATYPPVGAGYSDDDSRIAWLKSQVVPVVRRLRMRYSDEYLHDLLFGDLPPPGRK